MKPTHTFIGEKGFYRAILSSKLPWMKVWPLVMLEESEASFAVDCKLEFESSSDLESNRNTDHDESSLGG